METFLLIVLGIFIGWVVFRSQKETGKHGNRLVAADKAECGQRKVRIGKEPARQSQVALRREKDHTLRNVAGGVAAGAILGHMLSGDKKNGNQEITNNYTNYNDDWLWEERETEIDEAADGDYAAEDTSVYEDAVDDSEESSFWNDSYDNDEDY
ncbi:hypothetical protein SAMN05216584_106117 [Selenomonas sp. WCT3]|uniref:hypothetical protein n=1 Tax=Selenomonas sp. WCT3 TaxID=3158785 RepID=UPI000882DFF0|nr:hypothetical protein SAMN05216584_106117 [Selenomonas ruminantium]